MSALETLGIALLAGVVVGHVVPIVVGGFASEDVGDRLTGIYTSLAMAMVGSGILLWKNPRWRLKKATFDPDVNEYRISLKGRTRHFADPLGLMSRLAGRPFGIAHADRKLILSPPECDVGSLIREARRTDSLSLEDGERTLMRAYFDMDGGTATVNVDDGLGVTQGSSRPSSVEETFKIVELAQSVWNTTNVVDYGIWVTSMGVPFFMALIASRLGGSGAATNLGSRIGLMVGVLF